jgi:hypothetical protein
MSDPAVTNTAEKPAPPEDGRGWAVQLNTVVGTVQKSPYAAVLAVGLLIVVAAFIRKVGTFELVAEGSQLLIAGVGLALCLIGLVGPLLEARRSLRNLKGLQSGLEYHGPGRDLPAEALDPAFLFKVFYLSMPPAFVKRVDPADHTAKRQTTDIIFSRQLDRFQDSDQTTPVSSDRRSVIRADHRRGDDAALQSGRSRQVELPDSYVDGELFPILTCKTRFAHNGATYIAGWYVPIELPEAPEGNLVVKEEVRQLLFQPVLAAKGAHIPVGKAIKNSAQ